MFLPLTLYRLWCECDSIHVSYCKHVCQNDQHDRKSHIYSHCICESKCHLFFISLWFFYICKVTSCMCCVTRIWCTNIYTKKFFFFHSFLVFKSFFLFTWNTKFCTFNVDQNNFFFLQNWSVHACKQTKFTVQGKIFTLMSRKFGKS